MDGVSSNSNTKPNTPSSSRKRRNICIAVSAVIIFILVLVVILAFTVFKPKRPVTTVNSVNLQDFGVSVGVLPLAVHINLTLNANISIKNPNKVSIKYSDSSALLNYDGQVVGQAPIPAGKISSDQTVSMNLTLTVMAERLLSNSKLYSDVSSGMVPLNTLAKIAGKVTIMSLFKVHFVSTASCDLTINVSNRTVGNKECTYKTEL